MLGMALLQENRTADAQVLLDRILRDGGSAESRTFWVKASISART